jgi:hypothetical protein
VDTVFKLFDRLTAMIPENILRFIRLGALFVWMIAATIAGYIAWGHGRSATPASGQDLYLIDIKEKIQKEQNMSKAPAITVPNLNELVPEDKLPDMSHLPSSGLTPAGEKKEDGELPPFLSENESSVYPKNTYLPKKDAGDPGNMQNTGDDASLLPLRGKPETEKRSEVKSKKNEVMEAPREERSTKMEKPFPEKRIRNKDLLPMD